MIMLSFVCDFNLKISGDEAEKYITRILREWPELYEKIPGTHGILFLSNAFALAGEYSYSYRLDIDSFKTLKAIDDVIKSDDRHWKRARAEWFKYRGEVQARVLKHQGGDREFFQQRSKEVDDMLVYTLSCGFNGMTEWREYGTKKLIDALNEAWGGIKGIHSLQHHTMAVQPFAGDGYEAWARLKDFDTLDDITEAKNREELAHLLNGNRTSTRLYGVLREVDGVLLSGA